MMFCCLTKANSSLFCLFLCWWFCCGIMCYIDCTYCQCCFNFFTLSLSRNETNGL